AAAPVGTIPTVAVAFATIAGTPRKTSVENVMRVPPPAIDPITLPANDDARRAEIFAVVMKRLDRIVTEGGRSCVLMSRRHATAAATRKARRRSGSRSRRRPKAA